MSGKGKGKKVAFQVRVQPGTAAQEALLLRLPSEVLVSIFLGIEEYRSALLLSAACRSLLFLTRDTHCIAKWLLRSHGKYLSLQAAIEMFQEMSAAQERMLKDGKGKKTKKAKSPPVPTFPEQFHLPLVQSLLQMGAELSRSLVQTFCALLRSSEKWAHLSPVGAFLSEEGLKLYPYTLKPAAEAIGNDDAGLNAEDDEDVDEYEDEDEDEDIGVPVHWLSEYVDPDEVVFRHTLASYPHHMNEEQAHSVIHPIVVKYRFTPNLDQISPTHIRRLYSLGSDVFNSLMERWDDDDGRINMIIALTSLHRDAEPGEWPVVLSDHFEVDNVFGLNQDSDIEGSQPLPRFARKQWTCYITEDMVKDLLMNKARFQDYRGVRQILFDAFNILILEGRHLCAQALFEEFQIPVASLEDSVVSHLQTVGGCYYPGGVYMVNWCTGIRGVSTEFREACAFEIARGIMRKQKWHGKARAALEACYFRVTGEMWSEDAIPESLREPEVDLSASGSTSATSLPQPSLQ
ncbi:hypothetical protein HDU97_000124 [Phlyctochytrium planicorne]|nr:hypothetical protein HDU97_000124 [Phlyctochytrium planicorne]